MFSVAIFRYASSGNDCTNGGVSSAENRLYVLLPDESLPERMPEKHLLFREEKRGEENGRPYMALVPVFPQKVKGWVGPMAGGNLAMDEYGCHSRRGVLYHVHDRFESPELAEILSR